MMIRPFFFMLLRFSVKRSVKGVMFVGVNLKLFKTYGKKAVCVCVRRRKGGGGNELIWCETK